MALLLGEERVARLARLWMWAAELALLWIWAAELLSRLGEDQYVGLVLSRKRMGTWMVWCSGQRLQEVVQFVCGLPASKLAQTHPPTLLRTGTPLWITLQCFAYHSLYTRRHIRAEFLQGEERLLYLWFYCSFLRYISPWNPATQRLK